MNEPKTTWRIKELPDQPWKIDVVLTVDTTAEKVVTAIEKAAQRHGIRLERVKA